jgi:hypothetical protein
VLIGTPLWREGNDASWGVPRETASAIEIKKSQIDQQSAIDIQQGINNQ